MSRGRSSLVSPFGAHTPAAVPLQYIVVPGNVGTDDLLIRLVDALMER